VIRIPLGHLPDQEMNGTSQRVVKNLLARWLSAPEEEGGGASDDDEQCNSMDATRRSVPTLFIAAPMEGIQIIQLDAGYGHNLAFAEDRPK